MRIAVNGVGRGSMWTARRWYRTDRVCSRGPPWYLSTAAPAASTIRTSNPLRPLTAYAQLVYLDLPDHGRSDWGEPADWTFEACADTVRAFCDALGIEKPLVLGHSMGSGPIVLQPAG